LDIPIAYLEAFLEILNTQNKYKLKSKLVLTANAHFYNEFFKIWVANQISAGSQLITLEHGSGIPTKFSFMDLEEDIAFKKATWCKPYHSKHIQLPPSKHIDTQFLAPATHSREFLSILGYASPRYGHRAQSMPHAGQTLTGVDIILLLINSLNLNIANKVKVRPYPNNDWNISDRFSDILGPKRVSNNENYYNFLNNSKLILSTYPLTNLSESFLTGIPTVMLYKECHWETRPEFTLLIEKMKKANIIFTDPAAAALHINRHWDNLLDWWGTSTIQDAVNSYKQECLSADDISIQPWFDFIEKLTCPS
jgi:putative transferase (TIGR04331 family)